MPNKLIKIEGGEPVHGTVTLSGDPFSAVFLISKTIQFASKKKISNIPRVKFVLDFIDLVKELNVLVEWVNEDTIEVDSRQELKSNVNAVSEGNNLTYQRILIPALINQTDSCTISTLLKSEADFYKSLGLEYKTNAKNLEIKSSLEAFSSKYKERINTDAYNKDTIAARIMLAGMDPHLDVVYDKSDAIFEYLELEEADFIKIGSLKAAYSQIEFNFYASIAAFASTEVTIKNYDLSQSLNFLLHFNKIVGTYEVDDDLLKMWPESRDLEELYDLSDLPIDAVGYLTVILSLSISKSVQIVFDNSPEALELITDLNIFGCKLFLEEKDSKSVLTVRPIKSLARIKASISSFSWGGVIIFCAIISKGLNTVENPEHINHLVPYIFDNLNNLHVDIKH